MFQTARWTGLEGGGAVCGSSGISTGQCFTAEDLRDGPSVEHLRGGRVSIMSLEAPPPLPVTAQPVNMAPRWIGWVAASVLCPLFPLIPMSANSDEIETVWGAIAIAMILQLFASIVIAIGAARKRGLGVGGVIGLSIAFMAGSVAIGSAVFFVGCLTFVATNWH